jgi:hypothetical protein
MPSWYAHAIPENDHEVARLLGNILNQGNTAGTLPKDAMFYEMSSECLPKRPLPRHPR